MHTCGASPFDMYAARVASLYAERQPLCDVVRLWDAVLAGGPHVVLTLCVAEALLRRGELLAIGCDGVAACFSGGGASRSSSREVGVCALLAVPVETFLSLAARVEAALPAAMRAALHAWSVRVSMPLASGTVAVTMTADRDVHTPRMLVGTDRVQCVLPPKAPVLRATAARGARATARRRAAAIARSDSSDSDSDSDEGTTRRRQRQAPSASVSSAGTSPPQLTSTSSPSDVAALPDGGESEARPSASRGALPSSAVPDVAAPAWRALHAFRAPPAAAAVYHALGVAAVRAWTAAHPLHLNDALSASAGGAADHDGGTISGSEPADVPASGAPAATTVRVHPSVALRRRMGSIVTSAAPASAPLPIAPAASRPPTSMVQVLRAAVAAGDLEVSERRTYRPRVPDAQEAVPAFARPSHAAGARAALLAGDAPPPRLRRVHRRRASQATSTYGTRSCSHSLEPAEPRADPRRRAAEGLAAAADGASARLDDRRHSVTSSVVVDYTAPCPRQPASSAASTGASMSRVATEDEGAPASVWFDAGDARARKARRSGARRRAIVPPTTAPHARGSDGAAMRDSPTVARRGRRPDGGSARPALALQARRWETGLRG